MPRPLKVYTVAEACDARLSSVLLDTLGWPPNRSDQGSAIVIARTKVAAAEILGRAGMSYRPAQLAEASGNDVDEILREWHLATKGVEGSVFAWRGMSPRDRKLVRFAAGFADREDFGVVGHWRETERNRFKLITLGRDPLLLPHREFPIAQPETPPEYVGDNRRGKRTMYPGNVATFESEPDIWIGGLGYLDVDRAREMVSGLAGAITELEART